MTDRETTLVTQAHALGLYREMLRIRRFEEKCIELYQAEQIRGFLHVYIGEEAIAVGAMAALGPEDAVFATYREHGHALARGVPMDRAMAELLGKAAGTSRGRGGSMHLFDVERGFFGGNAIVAGHLPLATGMALAHAMRKRSAVVACFFGEGATAEGEFQESLNLAALWRLPVVFFCENNGYAMGTALARAQANVDLVAKAAALGVASASVDGMDVLAVEAASRDAVQSARDGGGPRFLELRTYRFRGHSSFDAQLYRDKSEVAAWEARDPLPCFAQAMQRDGVFDDQAILEIEAAVRDEVDAAVAFAQAAEPEPAADLLRDVTTPRPAWPGHPPSTGTPARSTIREAIRAAIAEAIGAGERVFLLGEDVGKYGGCYAVSRGLLDRFGPDRVRDTPLSESAFVGAAIGAALGGMRPIVEVMTVNFSLLALDQILNNAATLRHMSGGQLSVPVVIRMATGAGAQLAAQHSHSLEGWYAHIPGIRVLAPATLEDARGMLAAALLEPDPVVIFEHVMLYNVEGDLPADAGPVDIEHATVRRSGRDVSLLAWGGSMPKVLAAADLLAAEGIEAEVIDLRVLRPLDVDTLTASVRRTRRAVVVDEAWRTGSFAAEIAARLSEETFFDLDAPIERVCSAEVPVPYPRLLQEAALPKVAEIVAAARRACHRTEGAHD